MAALCFSIIRCAFRTDIVPHEPLAFRATAGNNIAYQCMQFSVADFTASFGLSSPIFTAPSFFRHSDLDIVLPAE